MALSHIILTNCTARKRAGVEPLQFDLSLRGSSLRETARKWKSALAEHAPKMRADHLYVGRAIAEAKRAAAHIDGSLWIASAGAGLVCGEQLLAPYDLTTSASHGGFDEVLHHHDAEPKQWWSTLCGRRNLVYLLSSNPNAMLLAALPASYLEMIGPDLEDCTPLAAERIRIFTSRAGAEALSAPLQRFAMPYDERLECIQGYQGTRADFPQRALRHFVEALRGHRLSLSPAQSAVLGALQPHTSHRAVSRKRVNDEVIKRIIRGQWRRGEVRSSVLLRHVRDVALVACEQSRFAKLWRSVKDEMNGRS